MGFLKKIKDIAEKGGEKGTELGTQGMRVLRMLPKKDTAKPKNN
jgi:hypothetical protein